MDALEAIRTRRSVRVFQKKSVPAELIRQIIDAAMFAPSAVDAQPWHFVVIDDPQLLKQIAEINEYAKMASQAAAAVLVCGDRRVEKAPGFWVQDCSAATQNLLLAAHALGLGAVWTGVHPNEKVVAGYRSAYHLPVEVIPLALVVLGYAAETPPQPQRFRQDRVHHNQW